MDPPESGFGWYRAARMRRTTSLFMGIPKARVICCAIRGGATENTVRVASIEVT